LDLVEVTSTAIERRHPWEEARFAFFRRVLGRAGLPAADAPVLDVGSGDAWFASRLAEETGAELVCWDTGYAAGAPPVRATGLRLTSEAPPERFSLVLALDVAEHVPDDHRFVADLVSERLTDGGHLLFSVPAWPRLFSRHDALLRHVRRYTPRTARALLDAAGVRVVAGGGLFHSLLLPRAAQKVAERFRDDPPRHAGEWSAPGWVTGAVKAALAVDTRASLLFSQAGWDVPGLSWWALCRKR